MGLPFYVSAVLMALVQYSDRLILARFSSSEEVGRYVLSWSVANVIQTLTYAVVAAVALPNLAKVAKMAKERGEAGLQWVFLNRWVGRSAALAGLLFVALIATLSVIQFLKIDRPHLPSLMLSSILGVAFVLRSVSDVVFGGLIAAGYRRASLISSAATLAVSVALYILLINRFGASGAATAFLLSAALGLLITYLTLLATVRNADKRSAQVPSLADATDMVFALGIGQIDMRVFSRSPSKKG
jgi:O-antigen/teichoic acid export membrane protein